MADVGKVKDERTGIVVGYHTSNEHCTGHPAQMLADYTPQPPAEPTPAQRDWDWIGVTEDGAQLYIEPHCDLHGKMHLNKDDLSWTCPGFEGEGCCLAASPG